MKFYSKTANGFFDDAIHKTLPNNALSLTDEAYQAIMTQLATGQFVLTADANGDATTAAFVPTSAQALATFKTQVQTALDASDITMGRISEAVALGTNSWTGTDVVAYVNYRRALRVLLRATTPATIPTAPAYPAGT